MAKICAKIRVQSRKKSQKPQKIDIGRLDDPDIKLNIKDRINTELNNIDRGDTENIWNQVKNTLHSIAQNTLGNYSRPQSKDWMTPEIQQLFEERRKYKNLNYELYWELNREIQTQVRAAKNRHLNSQCQEIERLQSLHDDFNLHKKLKETAGICRRTNSSVLFNSKNEAVFEDAEKKIIWKEYIQRLFTDNNRSYFNTQAPQAMTGTNITKAEVERAIMSLKNRKATGPDEIPAEILKLIDENNIELFTMLLNHIYNTGQYPQDWLKSTFIAIPKKNHAKQCSEYRLISLMSHALKIFLRILHDRIYQKCEQAMGSNQFGFKEGMGTREALFCVQVLIQKCREVHKDIFLCFVDYEKAFDTIQHDKLMEILTSIGIDDKEIRCIRNLYWHQTAQINVNGDLTEEISISRGVRQGCILSPLLFNIYSERIFQESLKTIKEGIKINGVYVNNIRYADDTTVLASSLSGLQNLVNNLTLYSEIYGLKINTQKTKYMIVSKKNTYDETTLKIKNINVERVQNFKYLGVLINDQWDYSKEIRSRIEMARDAFSKYKKVLTSHDINIETKSRFVKCYIWSVLLYAVEVWTVKVADIKKIEAFEMWIYRRILKIPWTAHVTNTEVLRRMNREKELVSIIKKRKTAYLGHIMRNKKYKLLQSILQIQIEGRRTRGRKEMSWLKNIEEWTNCNDVTNLLNAARNRETFDRIVYNII